MILSCCFFFHVLSILLHAFCNCKPPLMLCVCQPLLRICDCCLHSRLCSLHGCTRRASFAIQVQFNTLSVFTFLKFNAHQQHLVLTASSFALFLPVSIPILHKNHFNRLLTSIIPHFALCHVPNPHIPISSAARLFHRHTFALSFCTSCSRRAPLHHHDTHMPCGSKYPCLVHPS